jgi:hypothetical protein
VKLHVVCWVAKKRHHRHHNEICPRFHLPTRVPREYQETLEARTCRFHLRRNIGTGTIRPRTGRIVRGLNVRRYNVRGRVVPFPSFTKYPLLPYIYPNRLLSLCAPPTFVPPSLPASSCAHSHVCPTLPVPPPPLHLCLLIMNPLSPCAPPNVRFPHLPPAMCHSMMCPFTVCSNSSPLQCYIRSISTVTHVPCSMCPQPCASTLCAFPACTHVFSHHVRLLTIPLPSVPLHLLGSPYLLPLNNFATATCPPHTMWHSVVPLGTIT